mgnify:CR=1 FL=1
MTEDEIKDNLINELIETESFALMQDDLNEIENLILENVRNSIRKNLDFFLNMDKEEILLPVSYTHLTLPTKRIV